MKSGKLEEKNIELILGRLGQSHRTPQDELAVLRMNQSLPLRWPRSGDPTARTSASRLRGTTSPMAIVETTVKARCLGSGLYGSSSVPSRQ